MKKIFQLLRIMTVHSIFEKKKKFYHLLYNVKIF